MVNIGRPSSGCYLCRSRRVKCDEKKPGCGNCKKLKRACPGYRTLFDAMHRNEMNSTQPKASLTIMKTEVHPESQMTQRTTRSHHQSRSESVIIPQEQWKLRQNSGPDTQILVEAIYNGTHSVYPPLTATLEERAICFFLANYVVTAHGVVKAGFLGFLLPLMKLQPSAILSDSLSAVALATFANQPNAKMLRPKAELAYSKALRQATNAIGDPQQAAEDTTLAAVLLLGFFETMTDSLVKENEGWNSWNSHLTGATALLKMRNPRGPMSPLTLELIWTVKSHLEWNEALSQLRAGVRGGPPICNHLQSEVAKARVDCDELMATAKRTPQDFERVLNLMRRAEAIEQGYLGWAEATPADWKYKSIGWIDDIPEEKLAGSKCFPGKIDKYVEVWTAHIWNLSRGSRLLNYSTIIRCSAWLCSPRDYRTTVEYEKAVIVGKRIIRDIIASVPNCLGEIPTAMDEPSLSGHSFACGEESTTRAKGLSGLFILWPLFSVATSDFVTEAQRTWAIARMKYATEELGVSQGSTIYSQQHLSVRVPSSMLEKDGLMPSKIEEMLSLQIPVQQGFPDVEEMWTNNVSHYPPPSPTSTSSSEMKHHFSPGTQYDWTLLNSGSVNMNMINNWPQQMQLNWFDPNLGANVIASAEAAQQMLAPAILSHHSNYPIEPQPENTYHDWLAC
ncbi:hypothetical protein NHQ30_008257 [Ciborinia camelliae]|nr:hypothetical protein NHQ30_008257 [Ciborinia camelliae]